MPLIPDPKVQPTLSVPQAGELLGLCRPAAYKAARSGEIPVIHVGRRLLVPTAKLLDMLGLRGGGAR